MSSSSDDYDSGVDYANKPPPAYTDDDSDEVVEVLAKNRVVLQKRKLVEKGKVEEKKVQHLRRKVEGKKGEI